MLKRIKFIITIRINVIASNLSCAHSFFNQTDAALQRSFAIKLHQHLLGTLV